MLWSLDCIPGGPNYRRPELIRFKRFEGRRVVRTRLRAKTGADAIDLGVEFGDVPVTQGKELAQRRARFRNIESDVAFEQPVESITEDGKRNHVVIAERDRFVPRQRGGGSAFADMHVVVGFLCIHSLILTGARPECGQIARGSNLDLRVKTRGWQADAAC